MTGHAKLQGRGAVVTGAAGGIGRALATRLVAEGARVVVNDVDAQALAATAEEIGALAVDLLSHDEAIPPSAVADAWVDSLADDRFLVLPHAEVAGYYAARAADTDRWLAGMRRLQSKVGP